MSPHFYRVVKEIYGYKNVHAFYAGFPTWQKTGHPVISEPEFLKFLMDEGASYILVDLRSPEKAKKSHIPGAVNYPASDIKNLFKNLPDNQKDKKKARIIYYSDNMKDSKLAHRTMRVNGYDKGYILNGGIQGWIDKGYPVANNSLKTEIVYEHKALPGVISINEFRKLEKERPSNKVILDVRSAGEVIKEGMLEGSLNIPVDTLDKRWNELSKDNEYIVHCNAGRRARMGYMILKDKGYNVRYLDSKLWFNKDGTYELAER